MLIAELCTGSPHYRLSVVVVVVRFSWDTGLSTVVVVLLLFSITSPRSSCLDEQPTMVANRIEMATKKGIAIFFLFIVCTPSLKLMMTSQSS